MSLLAYGRGVRAVLVRSPGGPDELQAGEVPEPEPAAHEVVVDVAAAGVNRADLLQRTGRYPVPEGAPPWPGLECSGTVSAVGSEVTGWSVGDRVCALLDGGGYAERVAVRANQLLPVPDGVSLEDAAALPEAAATVWSNVHMTGRLRAGETLLVHGGSSGVGTFAVQLASALGARVAVTAGSAAKLAACRDLGAEILVNYRERDFAAEVLTATDGAGVDVVLDPVGGPYLARNLEVLAPGGRLVVIGVMGGRSAELDLALLMNRRASVVGTTLRARPWQEKAAIVAEVVEHVWPLVAEGRVRPVVQEVLPMDRAADAHRLLEASEHVGKVLLRPGWPTMGR